MGNNCTNKLQIKLKQSKSVYIDSTKEEFNILNPYENTAKYLDMTLDMKLRWKAHNQAFLRYNTNNN